MYIFLDESGNLKTNRPEGEYFVISIIMISHPKQLEVLVRRTKQAKLSRKQRSRTAEVKASKATDKFKKYFYERFPNLNLEVYAIVYDVLKTPEQLRDKQGLIYLHLTKELLKQANIKKDQEIYLYLDKRSLKGITHLEFDTSLKEEFVVDFKRPTRFEIYHVDSRTHNGIQAADFISHAIYEKYQKEYSKWYDLIRDKIREPILVLP